MRWAAGGAQLASGSDDRTLRVWSIPPDPPGQPLPSADDASDGGVSGAGLLPWDLRPRLVLYGHTARLWDCVFDPSSDVLYSASEDCTWRAWDLKTGACLATVEVCRERAEGGEMAAGMP